MKITPTEIPDVMIIEPHVFHDQRGYFIESYNKEKFPSKFQHIDFVQDNESKSSYGVLRGLHYQIAPYSQTKLVRVIKGSVIDVIVDIRKGSPTFGNNVILELSEHNKKQLFIPRGFAHGFVVTSKTAIFSYKCDNYYSPTHDRGILYNDPALKIDWKVPTKELILSEKDKNLPLLKGIADLFDYKTDLYE
ncbi:dTDP-4-dehydrorhamnose 3,5-epimerase [Aquimarina agarilytica]|uniref:dTDP-4-dehydrorhamnose 3,5-epimerase n=1 Tax=Aquimarina agarilytica TaxID=1087449 RepID=UPI00028A3A54|nr:dTDP-4-dehydrorhamnose 3,5-epimerase [Aquimarina agarilytica]